MLRKLTLAAATTVSSLLFSLVSPIHAETMYLFASDRSVNPDRASSIHRYSFDSENPAELAPAPSKGKPYALWGDFEGKPYKGQRFQGITVAPNGDVYAVSLDTKNLIRFDGQTGENKGEIVSGLNNPDGVTVGPDGNLYISNNDSVLRCKLDGTPVAGDGQIGNLFTAGGRLAAASGLAFGPDGNLYVASQSMNQILCYDGENGAFLKVFASEGISTPSGIAWGKDGDLYVASTGGPAFNSESGYVARLDGVSGKLLSKFVPTAKGALSLQFGINNDLFVSGYWNAQIARYSAADGQQLGTPTYSPGGNTLNYLTLARLDTTTSRLQPVTVKLPKRVAVAVPLDKNDLGAETVKGWKNALIPQGQRGPLLKLAAQGKTAYSIVLPANASTMDQKAASLLGMYLKQMTDATFPLVRETANVRSAGKTISIGHTDLLKKSGLKTASLDLRDEGYAIAAQNENLFLFGGRVRGAIYAVTALLEEDLGCRWYGSEGKARIPRITTLDFQPVLRHFVPVLEIRDPYYLDAFDVDWSLKNKTNSSLAKIPVEFGGYANYGGFFTHTFDKLVPTAKYFKEHPEYFALVNGQRTASQLDLSNPDVLQISIQTIRETLRANPEMKFISVSPNDGRNYCECPICRALDEAEATVPNSKSGSLLNFVNKVAAAIEPEFPNLRVTTLAYLNTFMPPKTIRPRKNVAIHLASDSHAWKYQFYFMSESQNFKKAMEAWKAIGADVHIWDYTASYVHYLVPMPNMAVVAENIHFMVDHGAKGIMLQGVYNTAGGENSPMRSWVWAKQLWDPTLDTHALIRDFIYGYYGEAAEPMWNYNMMQWQLWEENHAKPHVLDDKIPEDNPLLINASPNSAAPDWSLFSKEYLDKATQYFEQAEALAKDAQTQKRVQTAKASLLYIKLGQGLGYITEFGDYKSGTGLKAGESGKAQYANLYQEFSSVVKSANITRVSEHLPIENITSKWEEMLARGWVGIPSVKLGSRWKFNVDAQNVGTAQNWFGPQFDDSQWKEITSDRRTGWESQGFPDHKGIAWYRQKLTLPVGLEKCKYLYMYFSAIDSESEVYVNGVKVFNHTLASTGLAADTIWNTPFAFDAAPFLKANEENTIAVRVTSSGGVRGIWKPAYLFSSDNELNIAHLNNATLLEG